MFIGMFVFNYYSYFKLDEYLNRHTREFPMKFFLLSVSMKTII